MRDDFFLCPFNHRHTPHTQTKEKWPFPNQREQPFLYFDQLSDSIMQTNVHSRNPDDVEDPDVSGTYDMPV